MKDEDQPKLVFPALGRLYAHLSPYSCAFMRFCTGAILTPHGFQKLLADSTQVGSMERLGLAPPIFWAYLVACTEGFGGILLAIGLFTRFAALAIAIEMAVITFALQWPNGYFWTQRGFEYPLFLGLLSVAVFFKGGGRYSVDHALGKEL